MKDDIKLIIIQKQCEYMYTDKNTLTLFKKWETKRYRIKNKKNQTNT